MRTNLISETSDYARVRISGVAKERDSGCQEHPSKISIILKCLASLSPRSQVSENFGLLV